MRGSRGYRSDAPRGTGVGPKLLAIAAPAALAAAFAALPAAGQGLLITGSTYYGGAQQDMGWGVCVAPEGDLLLVGETYSADFPVTPAAFDTTYAALSEGQFARAAMDGSTLRLASFLGSANRDAARAIAVDAAGCIYITGTTNSQDFPVTPDAAFPALCGGVYSDAFLVKLDPTGSELLYGSYLGGGNNEKGRGIVLLGPDLVAVTGYTLSHGFPTTPFGFDTEYNGGWDLFVTVFNLATGQVVYSTYFGGSGDEEVWDLEGRPDGSLVFCGWTASTDFPTTLAACDPTHNGSSDGFIACLVPRPAGLRWSTFLGGADRDAVWEVALARDGGILATGHSEAQGFPVTPGAYDPLHHGGSDAFALELTGDGSQVVFSTFLGGSADDGGEVIQQSPAGVIYCAGNTYSHDFPTTGGSPDPQYGGDGDIFVCALDETGSTLLAGTFLGGAGSDIACGLAIPHPHLFTVVGRTFSADFPVTPGAFDTTLDGDRDACLTTFYFYTDQGVPTGPAGFGATRLLCTPNPVRAAADIRFEIGAAGPARLELLDVQGRSVATLLRESVAAGQHRLSLERPSGSGALPSGSYWLRLTASGAAQARRVVLLP